MKISPFLEIAIDEPRREYSVQKYLVIDIDASLFWGRFDDDWVANG